jgi:hypothetical protein
MLVLNKLYDMVFNNPCLSKEQKQNAIDYYYIIHTELERLQKKETPMKVNRSQNIFGKCQCGNLPLRHHQVYCDVCGQKLDWSEENE